MSSIFKTFAVAAFFLLAISATTAQSLPEMRMTPTEIKGTALDNNQIGSSAVPGVHTKVLFGDPSKEGFYVILSSCRLTPPSRPTRTTVIGWPRLSQENGTSATVATSMRSN